MARSPRRSAPTASPSTRTPEFAGVKTSVEQITPAIAEEWLGRNSHNRPIRNNRVADLSGAMTRGEWVVNGDAIRWSDQGVLLDGQHRLWAVVESGITIESLVVRGLRESAQETMDVGARRSLKDTLVLRNVVDAAKIAAVLNYKWRYDNGHVRLASARPTIAQAIAVYESNPDGLREAARQASRLNQRFRISVAMSATVYDSFASIDQDDADAFWESLLSGADLGKHSPILVLRRYLERQSAVGRAGETNQGARASSVTVHALFIKAWNAYRAGEEVEVLSWKASGLKAEAFPEPK